MATRDPAAPYRDPTPAQLRYNPSSVLPITNSGALTAEPVQITAHGSARSGTNRKIKANTAASIRNDSTKLADSRTIAGTGSTPPTNRPASVTAVVANIEDVSTSPAA